jgi:hypothetical protein
MSGTVAKKPLSPNILCRFGQNWPADACGVESGFVNHDSLTFRIGLSQGVLMGVFFGSLCGAPALSPQRRREGLACASY